MPVYKFTNNAKGTIEGAVGAGDTEITLSDGDGALFPALGAGEQFVALILQGSKSEWVTCTNIAGDSLTVLRGTPPQSFDNGAIIELRLNADTLNIFLQKGEAREIDGFDDPNELALTPLYFGEEVYLKFYGTWWKSVEGDSWLQMGIEEIA